MKKLALLPFLAFLYFAACTNKVKVIDDFSDTQFKFLNQDSTEVVFPDDFKNQYVVMGFLYTNCPDICPLITQNLLQIQKNLNYPENVQFVALSFDPQRDTPSVLKRYGELFGTGKNFTFLTGDTLQVNAFLDSARVRVNVSMRQTTESGKEIYFLNHSDKMMVFDKKGRLIIEYGGSYPQVPKLLTEDFQQIL